jgi:hypothetical protein
MNKVLPKTKINLLTTFNASKQFYFVLLLSMMGMVSKAQCIGPYARFESIGSSVGNTPGFVFTTSAPGSTAGVPRSGRYYYQTAAANSALKTPAIAYPKTFSFYIKAYSAATLYGTLAYKVEYSLDDFATAGININTVPGFVTPTITTGYQKVSVTLPYSASNSSVKFKITDTNVRVASVLTGNIIVDDISWDTYTSTGLTSSGHPENTTIAPVQINDGTPAVCSGGTFSLASNTSYNFYDNGGATDEYSINQNNEVIFVPANPGDKIKITFISYTAAAGESINVWDDPLLPAVISNTAATFGTLPTYTSSMSSDGSIKIKFISDGTTNAAGFNILVDCLGGASISGLNNVLGCAGAPFTINGAGLSGATAVTVGGVPVSSIFSNTSTSIVVYPTAGSTGPVAVTLPSGTVTGPSYTTRPLIVIAAGSNSPVCPGTPVTLSASASGGSGSGYGYSWSGPSSYTDPTQNPTVSASATAGMAGVYTLTVSDGNSCSNTATTTVAITTAPTTSTNGGNLVACSGTNSAALGGNTPSVGTGLWSCTAAPGGGSTSHITFTSNTTGNTTAIVATNAVAGNYTLQWTITNSGCTSVSSLTLTVNAAPTITPVAMAGQSVCLNGATTPLSISATAGSGTIASYQWYSNTTASTSGGSSISGANASTYTPLTTALGTLYYYCVVTNSLTCASTSAVSGAIVISSTPAAPTATAATSIGGSVFTANWGAIAGATGYFLDVSTVNTFSSFVTGYNNLSVGNVTSASVSGLGQGLTYYYRVRAANSCVTTASSNTITVATITLTYCAPTYSSGDALNDQITNVTLGTLSNSTGISASPYYTFYNAVTIPNLYQGATSTISVSFGSDSRQYVGVWIDFNQNGTFETSEGVVSTNNAGGSGTAILTLTIPGGALLGNTRMRVRGGDDNAMTTAMACGASNSVYGETEDYIVNIINIPPCAVALPTALTSSFITGTTATLSWSDASFAPSSIYEYAFSTSNVTPASGTTIAGATSVNLTGLIANTTYYYWVRTNCGGSNQSSWAGPSTFYTDPLDVVNLNSTTNGATTTSCNARFYDSGGATGTYSSSESYTYTFVPGTVGSKLKAVFNSFALESGYDFMSVYNGTTANAANLIGIYTGAQISAGQAFFSTAAGGELTFKFTSDGIINYAGWDVSLTCVTVPTITSFTPTSTCAGATPVVTLTGTNFTGATTVSFNGVTATPTTVTATSITVTLPALATSGFISVSTPTATGTSTTAFTVKPLPSTPNAGADTSVCTGGSVVLNAVGSIGNQNIMTNNCSSMSGWITNDSNRWSIATSNNASGSAGGELRFTWFASGATNANVYYNQLINTAGYTALNLSFRHMVDWFSNSFDLYVETSPDNVTWTQRWNTTPTADIAASGVSIDLSALNGTSFYIRFRFNGNAFDINQWYIDDVTLSGAPTLTYSWAANASLSSTSVYNPTATPASTQTYSVTTTLNGCNSVADDVIVSVNTRPTSVMSGTQAVCNGNTASLSVALTGTAPWSLTYTNGVTPVTVSGIMSSPYTFTTPAITAATTYTVTAVSDSKCAAIAGGMTGNAAITISAAPTITSAAAAAPVCYSNSSQTTTLAYTATTGSIATYSVVWNSSPSAGVTTVSNAPFTGSSPINVTVPGLLNNGTNNATLIVKSAAGCVSASYPFTVDINPSPAVTMSVSTRTICYSASSQTTSYSYTSANVVNSYDVTWNAVPANSLPTILNAAFTGTTGTISITVPAGTPGGTYTGTVTPKNATCGVGAAPRTITLIVSQPSITPDAAAAPVCVTAGAQTTTLAYSNAIATPTLYSISWNAVPSNSFATITDAAITASPLTINIPAGTAANTYTGTVSVKNANGCISPGYDFSVVINDKPAMTSSFTLQTVCPSASAQAAVLSYSAVSNAASYSIDWDATANTAGLADQSTTVDAFVSGNINTIAVPANLPVNQYSGTITLTSANGCVNAYAITMFVGKRWNGTSSSDWASASNWTPSGQPVASDCVIIPSGTPNSPVIASNANSGTLTISTGATVTVNAGFTIKVVDFVKTDGTLTINNGGSLVQVNNVANTGSGSMVYNRDVTGLNGYDYVYWSSPVASQTLSTIYPAPSMGFRYYWDTLLDNGNGASGNTSQGNWASATGTMDVGKGYIVRASSNYNWSGTINSSFVGTPNNGTITYPLNRGMYQGAIPYVGINGLSISNKDDNYNLIGNPYPSAINAIDFLNSPANSSLIDGYVYLWTHGTTPSSLSNPFYSSYSSNYYLADYLIYNSLGSSSVPTFDGKIASGQGFFVTMLDGPTVTDNSQPITFNNSMRNVTYTNSQFYKASQNNETTSSEKHRIWIDLIDSNSNASRTLVGYASGATNNKDRNFDAYTSVNEANILYSLVGTESLAIQGRALPFDVEDQVPLGFHAAAIGNYTMAIATVDGLFEQGQPIYVEDKLLGIIHDLRQAPYNFTTTQGTFNDRLVLRYTNTTLAINQYTSSNVAAVVSNGQLQINANTEIDTVQVFDLTGKLIKVYNPSQKSIHLKDEFSFERGVYLAKIKLTNGTIVSQKIMN